MDNPDIHAEMTVLDVVSAYNATQAVFKKYDEVAKECICCNALFETLQHVSDNYGINIESLIKDLKQSAAGD